ncbi:phospholipase A2 [Deinococcus yavapaiensis]|uniref:Phospholipase A2-like protein n=1 Tax=Deinococcus yavapaiensis KR-236 TaxID=694435 RepID=A0A318S822_9DEIO|nr:phospholipase A2 [Deinococcus yavapaiensis]PYE55206.1 phospholipase A2-like protein [Deinococcus yavapaiensis KR-236]
MHKRLLMSALGLASLLAACGQSPIASATPSERAAFLAAQPELEDATSQAFIRMYGHDPEFLANVEQAYGGARVTATLPAQPRVRARDLASDRLAYIKSVAWGTVVNYDAQYANQAAVNVRYPGLDWTRDGCSAPSGLGLGYREDFRPACNVHDFGYRNLKVYERTEANRKTTDDVFRVNMNAICAAKSWYARPACYSAAYAYYEAVRVGGADSF